MPLSLCGRESCQCPLARAPLQGVLSGCAPNVPVSFYIQARDAVNTNRTTGGDVFRVTLERNAGGAALVSLRGSDAKDPVGVDGKADLGDCDANVVVVDEGSGRYCVTYTAPGPGEWRQRRVHAEELLYILICPGRYSVRVHFDGTFGGSAGAIRGSPFRVFFHEGASPEVNTFGGGLTWSAARELAEFSSKLARHTLEGITQDVSGGQLDVLLAVKTHLSDLSTKEAELRLKVDVARSLLDELRRPGVEAMGGPRRDKELAAVQARLDRATAAWEDAKKQVPQCRAAIAPHVKTHSLSVSPCGECSSALVHSAAASNPALQTRKAIEAFEAETAEYARRASEGAHWRFETGACVRAGTMPIQCSPCSYPAHNARPGYEAAMTAIEEHEVCRFGRMGGAMP